jgi:hypothetical protein
MSDPTGVSAAEVARMLEQLGWTAEAARAAAGLSELLGWTEEVVRAVEPLLADAELDRVRTGEALS